MVKGGWFSAKNRRRVLRSISTLLGLTAPDPALEAERSCRRAIKLNDRAALTSILHEAGKLSLAKFLKTDSKIELPTADNPEISIILVLHAQTESALNCLYAIFKAEISSLEVIIADLTRTNTMQPLLERVEGARVFRNLPTLDFFSAANYCGSKARGTYLLFLNSNTRILSKSITSALETIKSSDDIGVVGGRIILPNGKLHSAGGILWQDGAFENYGRNDLPFASTYMFRRDVDFCSSTFLLTKRDLFAESGGFAEIYRLSPYEEIDYCIKLRKRGQRIVYEPNVIVIQDKDGGISFNQEDESAPARVRKVFVGEHKDWLARQYPATPKNILQARSARAQDKRILLIDDLVPHKFIGAGYPRSNRILSEMVNLGYSVTFYPATPSLESWVSVYEDIPGEVEVVLGRYSSMLEDFLSEREGYYHLVYVSRPHNMTKLNSILTAKKLALTKDRIIYDAEAIFSLREIEQRRQQGREVSPGERQRLINEELAIGWGSYCIITVSNMERHLFAEYGFSNVHTLSHAVDASPTPNPYDLREDILFVGAVHGLSTPNADSLLWFSKEIFPRIQEKLGGNVRFVIAGSNNTREIFQLASDSIKVLGKQDDLTSLYNRARLFVAPTRFAAGIPLKVIEAAAHGLPTVTTSLLAAQLSWEVGRELFVADTAETFAEECAKLYQDRQLWERLRSNALDRVKMDHSPEVFSVKLKRIIEDAFAAHPCVC
jgi:GT2 family glycosyltransferase/glycosyltransferase involved in cell wall biosynthesis